MSVDRDIRFDLIARLCPNSTGAELRSVATEAGMFAIRARRKVATERDFLDAVEKVVRQGTKFSSTYVLNALLFCDGHCVLIQDQFLSDPCIKCTTKFICSCSLPSSVESRILIDRENSLQILRFQIASLRASKMTKNSMHMSESVYNRVSDESGEDKKYCGTRSRDKIREQSKRLTKNQRLGDIQKILYRASVSFRWTRNDGAGMFQID